MEALKKPAVYSLTGMEGVPVTRGLAYGDDPVLLMDVYRPVGASTDERVPAVIFVHGGPIPAEAGLRPKDWGVFQSYGQLAAASGLAGVTFNHRLFGREIRDTAAGDVSRAIDYVRATSDALGIDPDRLAVWAFSGGGIVLAPLIAARPEYVRCLVAYYASLGLSSAQAPDTAPQEAAQRDRFSPLAQLERSQGLAVPMLIARAGKDRPELNERIDAFVQTALALNAPIEVLNHPGGQHGFDILDDLPRSRDIIARTLTFVRAQLA